MTFVGLHIYFSLKLKLKCVMYILCVAHFVGIWRVESVSTAVLDHHTDKASGSRLSVANLRDI